MHIIALDVMQIQTSCQVEIVRDWQWAGWLGLNSW